jgi:prepilin-type processing-associated H-X9-DG protein
MQWMSIAIGLPPSASLTIVIQGTDAAAADKLNDTITKAIDWAAQRKEGPPEALAFTQMLGGLKTQLQANRITIDLSQADVNKLAATIAGQMIQQQNKASRLLVANHLRHLSIAVITYANENNGHFPKDLGADLNKYLSVDAKELWTDPLRPNAKKPYVYLKLADNISDVKDPSAAVMIYENHTTWDAGINVAFADGHVEWMANEKQFKSMLADTKKNNPHSVEMPQ